MGCLVFSGGIMSGVFLLICAIAGSTVQAESLRFPAKNCLGLECIRDKTLAFLDKYLLGPDVVPLGNGVSIKRTRNDSVGSSKSAGSDLGTALINRMSSYFRTHSVMVNLKDLDGLGVIGRAIFDLKETVDKSFGDQNEDEEEEEVEEGRDKRKKYKKTKKKMHMLFPLLLIAKAKMSLATVAVGKIIAAIAAKALIVGKIALLIGSLLYLKKLIPTMPQEKIKIQKKKIVVPDLKDRNYMKDEQMWEAFEDYKAQMEANEMAYKEQLKKFSQLPDSGELKTVKMEEKPKKNILIDTSWTTSPDSGSNKVFRYKSQKSPTAVEDGSYRIFSKQPKMKPETWHTSTN